MTKTLKQVTDERMNVIRKQTEARYKKAAAQADNLEEIERLVDQIELAESDGRLVQLSKTLQLADADLKELRHLALRKLADLKAEGDLKVAEVLAAFTDIIFAHESGLGGATGFMADSFHEAQVEHLRAAEEILCRPPMGEEVGRKLAKMATSIGKAMRTRTDHNVAKAWAVLGAKKEVWRND